MERTIKFILIALISFFVGNFVMAEEISTTSLVTPQNVDFKLCTRAYVMPAEKLFYISIVAAKANRFDINEIQSKTGYILFMAAGKQYLASVIKIDNTHSLLKITPVNNNYFFAPGIVLNFFRYIDLNGATPLNTLQKI